MREAKYVMDNGLLSLARGVVLNECTAQLNDGIYKRSYNGHHIHHSSFKRHVNLSPW